MPSASISLTVPEEAALGDTLDVTTTDGGVFPIAVGPDMLAGAGKKLILKVETSREIDESIVYESTEVKLTKAEAAAAEEEEPTTVLKLIKCALPAGAKANDTITVTTQAGDFELSVPKTSGKVIEVEVPVPVGAKGAGLSERLIVSKMLLNGKDVSKATTGTPIKLKERKNSFEMMKKKKPAAEKGFRSVMVPKPAGAEEGDTLGVMTELGMLPVVVPKDAGKAFEAKLPVPDDFQLATLTVAFATSLFVKKKEVAEDGPAAAPAAAEPTEAAEVAPQSSSPVAAGATKLEDLTDADLKQAVKEVIRAAWPPDGGLTRKSVRRGVEELVGLAEGALEAQAAQVNAITDEIMASVAQEIEEVEAAREADDLVAQVRAQKQAAEATAKPTGAPSGPSFFESLCVCLAPPAPPPAAAAVPTNGQQQQAGTGPLW